jgi:hypothetical protein
MLYSINLEFAASVNKKVESKENNPLSLALTLVYHKARIGPELPVLLEFDCDEDCDED